VWIPGRRGITCTSTVTFDKDKESYNELVEVDIIGDPILYVSLDLATEAIQRAARTGRSGVYKGIKSRGKRITGQKEYRTAAGDSD
jgi:hypothetical protein